MSRGRFQILLTLLLPPRRRRAKPSPPWSLRPSPSVARIAATRSGDARVRRGQPPGSASGPTDDAATRVKKRGAPPPSTGRARTVEVSEPPQSARAWSGSPFVKVHEVVEEPWSRQADAREGLTNLRPPPLDHAATPSVSRTPRRPAREAQVLVPPQLGVVRRREDGSGCWSPQFRVGATHRPATPCSLRTSATFRRRATRSTGAGPAPSDVGANRRRSRLPHPLPSAAFVLAVNSSFVLGEDQERNMPTCI